MGKIRNLTGQRFERLVALKPTEHRNKQGSVLWECKCNCGQHILADSGNLIRGHKTSCGCRRREVSQAQGKRLAASNVGPGHPNWKGGRRDHGDGYVKIYAPGHPRAYRRYVYEHRLVIEEKLGRFLEPEESVHHLNGIKDNNSPDNLILFPNESAHQKYHQKLERICEET